MQAVCDNNLNPFESGRGLFGTQSGFGKSTEFIGKKKEPIKDGNGFRIIQKKYLLKPPSDGGGFKLG